MTTFTAPEFLVVEVSPTYCPITDGITGSQFRTVAAGSLAFAKASVARRQHQERQWGELGFHVAEAGCPIYRRYADLNAQPVVITHEDGMVF